MNNKEYRASEARRLLDEPLLNEALDRLERSAFEELLRVPFWQPRKQRLLIDRVRVIRGMRGHLRAVILDGEDARKRPIVA